MLNKLANEIFAKLLCFPSLPRRCSSLEVILTFNAEILTQVLSDGHSDALETPLT